VIDEQQGTEQDRRRWQSAYVDDVDAIEAFLGGDGITPRGRRVAVIDSGDGITALALRTRLGAARVDAFDDAGCDTEALATRARWYAGLEALPDKLYFAATRPYELPGDPAAYDLVVWWGDVSTRRDTVRMLAEIGRLLAPQAHVLLRAPLNGALGADELQHALLAAGMVPIRVDVPAVSVRPDLEQQAEAISRLATRGAVMLAYRAG
jgi:hypothetical protein